MDVQTITMDLEQAREQLREYRRILHRKADAEYEAVAAGLEAIGKGFAVLSLSDVVRAAGFDALMRPRLAIARADRKQVRFQWSPYADVGSFQAVRKWRGRDRWDGDIPVTFGRRHGLRTREGHAAWVEGFALVPMVPPEGVRKAGGLTTLERYHILWEVEHWADRQIAARADRDPFLLKHLGGELYAVIHEWDLTELERSVMGTFRRQG